MADPTPTISHHGLAARAAAIGAALDVALHGTAPPPRAGDTAALRPTTAGLTRWRTAFHHLVRDAGPFLAADGGGGGEAGARLVVAIADLAARLRCLQEVWLRYRSGQISP